MFKQTTAVTAMNLKTLPTRLWSSLVIVLGVAGVVGVIVSVLAMVTGLAASMEHAGRADRASHSARRLRQRDVKHADARRGGDNSRRAGHPPRRLRTGDRLRRCRDDP